MFLCLLPYCGTSASSLPSGCPSLHTQHHQNGNLSKAQIRAHPVPPGEAFANFLQHLEVTLSSTSRCTNPRAWPAHRDWTGRNQRGDGKEAASRWEQTVTWMGQRQRRGNEGLRCTLEIKCPGLGERLDGETSRITPSRLSWATGWAGGGTTQ